jgi:hypothetical protein
MRRFALICTIALAGVSGVSASADSAPVSVRGFVCQSALDPASRAVSITAEMRPMTGTTRLAMRFELLRRARRYGRPVSLAGSELKTWITPKDPTLGTLPGDRWIVKHPVVELDAPAFYRFRVTFRWTGSGGQVIGRAVRLGPTCFEPELRPDLQVTGIQVVPVAGSSGQDDYIAQIRNAGKTAADRFDVSFLDGGTYKSTTVPRLEPHHRVRVVFQGPACSPSQPATVTADPNSQIDDFDRSNNSMSVTCAASTAASSGTRARGR